jgi:ornithine decarboxylase
MTEERKKLLQKLAAEKGTPLFVVDHEILRENFKEFREKLPDVQPYFAVKANSNPEIIKTMFDLGSSFDVASIYEFRLVHENIKELPDRERQDFIWDKIIYANTIKPAKVLKKLNPYKILVTFDNIEELKKIREHAPDVGLVLRIRVPNTGSMVELSSKFGAHPGEAVDLIGEAVGMGLGVEGLSFHVGSQCNNFDNYIQALSFCSSIFKEAQLRGFDVGFNDKDGKRKKLLDIGGGFPVKYSSDVKPFGALAKKLNSEIKRLFGKENIQPVRSPASLDAGSSGIKPKLTSNGVQVIAEPGRFLVATACALVTKIIGKSVRDGKTCYYLDDGVYHTFSGQVYDHQHYPLHAFADGELKICATFGPTCDAFDTISLADELPEDLQIDDLLYAENIGAYTLASATDFNGFPVAKVAHINMNR